MLKFSSFKIGASAFSKRDAITLASAAMLGASAFLSVPVLAQDAKIAANEAVTPKTNCKLYKPGELMAAGECEILRGQALDTKIKGIDSKLSKDKGDVACMKKVQAFMDRGGKISRETLLKYGEDRICELAATLG